MIYNRAVGVFTVYVRYFIHMHFRALLSQLTDSHATAMYALGCIGCRGRCVEPQRGAGVSYARPYIHHGETFRRHAFSFTKHVKLHLSPTVLDNYSMADVPLESFALHGGGIVGRHFQQSLCDVRQPLQHADNRTTLITVTGSNFVLQSHTKEIFLKG